MGPTSAMSIANQAVYVYGCIGEAGSPVPRLVGEAQVMETTADTVTDGSELTG
ncbi:MAG: hypothetical protein QM706_14095 [Nitrospira sp.]